MPPWLLETPGKQREAEQAGPAVSFPPQAQTLGRGSGGNSWVLPWMAPSPRGGRDCGAWEGGRGSSRDRKQLPGCYPGEQRGEDLLGEGEPGDGHEASSDAPIEHLAPGVI